LRKQRNLGMALLSPHVAMPCLTACNIEATPSSLTLSSLHSPGYVQRALQTVSAATPALTSATGTTHQVICVANIAAIILRSATHRDAFTKTICPDRTAMRLDRQVDGWAHIVAPAECCMSLPFWSAKQSAHMLPAASPTKTSASTVTAKMTIYAPSIVHMYE
jgi:hypothetical protein